MKNRLAFVMLSAAMAVAYGQGTITTYAGSVTCCNSADGQQAAGAWLPGASGITLDKQGNLYIFDGASSKVRKVNTAGVLSTVAGNGNAAYTGDGGPALSASLFANGVPEGIAVDAAGNLYISDGNNHAIRKVDTSGTITTIAGNGTPGFSGDGGQATKALLQYPAGIVLDSAGNLYIADSSNSRVRKITPGGIISTYAGNGNVSYSGDGVQATATAVHNPQGLAIDAAGNLYISETGDSRVRKVAPNGTISTVAGQTKKTSGFTGDGGLAISAELAGPLGLAVDGAGNLYIADNSNGRVRKVDAAGIITTYAGITGTASSPLGDGGPAANAYLGIPRDLVLDSSGNLYIASSAAGHNLVRKVTPGAGLSASPSSLAFAYTIGGTAPANQTVSVSSSGGSPGFTAAASTSSGGSNWLSVTPTSGSAPGTITVAVKPAGIAGGVYQGAITLTPTTTGVSSFSFQVTLTVTGAGAPVITAGGIVNASGYQTKLAPDTVFVIFGSGMGPAALQSAPAPNYPTTLGGTSITFTPIAGGAAIAAKMIYTVGSQVAGLLPSSATPGTYAVRVTYQTLTSAPQNVTVVARSFGIATSNSAGSGTAQATVGNVNGGLSLTRFTSGSVAFGGYNWTLTPAHPGDTVVLWGTGGGADAANDSGGTSGDQTSAGGFTVSVGSKTVTPAYAGASSGYPGLWQINFVLPSDITPDCFASLQITAAGEVSNAVTLPIAASGQNVCTDSQLNAAALAALDGGGRVIGAGFAVAKGIVTNTINPAGGGAPTVTNATQETASGYFSAYTAAEYAAIFSGLKIDACVIRDRTASVTVPDPAAPDSFLNAGSRIPISGPGIATGAALTPVPNSFPNIYDLLLSTGTLAASGKYTLAGPGGTDTGAFNASVTFPPAFTLSGFDSLNNIDRSKPLTISWSGGGDLVEILASSYAVVGKDSANSNIVHNVAINCQVPGSAGSYTLSPAVLSHLLPASIDAATQQNGTGSLTVETTNSQAFPVTILSGQPLGFSVFTGTLAYSRNLAVQ